MAIETELKIKVKEHKPYADKLKELGASFEGTIHQIDRYFETTGTSAKADVSLRLRCERDAHGNLLRSVLCCKGRRIGARVKTRREIETLVSDPVNTEDILNSLGYQVSLSFDKKRSVWLLNECEVGLDELPLLGSYIEIEGPGEERVIETAAALGLDPANQQKRSYASLIYDALNPKDTGLSEIFLETPPKAREQKSGTDTPPSEQKSNDKGIVQLIMNPSSGNGFGASLTEKIKEYFEEKGLHVIVNILDEFKEIKPIIRDATNSPDCRLIAACGGDGTIRQIIHELHGSDKPLMIIPGGTANLLANELGCDKEVDTYQMMYEKNMISPLDIATVNGCCFTSILGIGFDAEIVELITKNRNGNISQADYIWPVWRTFWSHELPRFRVIADGEEIFEGTAMMFTGNISLYGPKIKILKDADISDGKLDLCIFPCKGKQDILKYFAMVTLGIHTKSSEVIYKKCRNIKVEPLDKQILTQIDGDPGPSLPLDIRIEPGAVRVYNAIKKSGESS